MASNLVIDFAADTWDPELHLPGAQDHAALTAEGPVLSEALAGGAPCVSLHCPLPGGAPRHLSVASGNTTGCPPQDAPPQPAILC